MTFWKSRVAENNSARARPVGTQKRGGRADIDDVPAVSTKT